LTNARFYNALSGFTQPIATYRNTSFTFQDMLSENASHNGFYAIAHNNNDTILGMCKLEPLKKYERVYLSSYIINPSVRGTGFNKEFLTAVLYHPQVQPYSRIELKVHEDNMKAYNTYKSLGFNALSKENKRHIMEYILF
jgi:RimJ/RimL family protein N-acetyltransferase